MLLIFLTTKLRPITVAIKTSHPVSSPIRSVGPWVIGPLCHTLSPVTAIVALESDETGTPFFTETSPPTRPRPVISGLLVSASSSDQHRVWIGLSVGHAHKKVTTTTCVVTMSVALLIRSRGPIEVILRPRSVNRPMRKTTRTTKLAVLNGEVA